MLSGGSYRVTALVQPFQRQERILVLQNLVANSEQIVNISYDPLAHSDSEPGRLPTVVNLGGRRRQGGLAGRTTVVRLILRLSYNAFRIASTARCRLNPSCEPTRMSPKPRLVDC